MEGLADALGAAGGAGELGAAEEVGVGVGVGDTEGSGAGSGVGSGAG